MIGRAKIKDCQDSCSLQGLFKSKNPTTAARVLAPNIQTMILRRATWGSPSCFQKSWSLVYLSNLKCTQTIGRVYSEPCWQGILRNVTSSYSFSVQKRLCTKETLGRKRVHWYQFKRCYLAQVVPRYQGESPAELALAQDGRISFGGQMIQITAEVSTGLTIVFSVSLLAVMDHYG